MISIFSVNVFLHCIRSPTCEERLDQKDAAGSFPMLLEETSLLELGDFEPPRVADEPLASVGGDLAYFVDG